MNDARYDELEQRLGRLDLQLSVRGDHVSDERLAEIVTGVDVTDSEATHLAGCDECLEVLMALGEGLEDLSTEQPELALLMTEPPVTRRPATVATTLIVLSLAACAMAATGWYVRGQMESLSPASTQSDGMDPRAEERAQPKERAVEAAPDRAPAVIAPKAAQDAPRGVVNEGGESKSAEEVERSVKMAEAARHAEMKVPTAKPEEPAVPRAQGATRSSIKARSDLKSQPKRSLRRSVVSKTPQTNGEGLNGRDGPKAFDRVAVDGAPRGFGQLRLNAKPAARVFIDGKDRGWTPVVDLRLQAGPHDVRLVFESELAERREDRFRVLIESEKTWSTVRDNRKASLRK